jgi:DNA-binding response OmpR family regulator
MARRVLVVEDDEDIARLVRLQLQELSCTVRTASDGAVGLAEAVAAEWDLIILDLMLPSVDGLEICRRVRGKDRYTPILMLTAKSSELDRVLGLEMGADDYLTKPFSVMELSAWYRCWRNTRRSQRRSTSSIPRRGCSRPTCAPSWILQRRGCASQRLDVLY